MHDKKIENIVIIGSGNVASHLALALSKSKKNILQIISKTESNAKSLAKPFDCDYSTNVESAVGGADLYLVAVTDNAIEQVVEKFPHKNALIVHTSGSISMEVLNKASNIYGVFYPLQTFTKKIELDYRQIPFCIEANSNENMLLLKDLAAEISEKVYEIDFSKRQYLHLAAVFACNFTNHFYNIASKILEKEGLSFEILVPLIKETVRKAEIIHPKNAQTGPAIRNDEIVIEMHLQKLLEFEDYQKIYTFITQNIKKEYNR